MTSMVNRYTTARSITMSQRQTVFGNIVQPTIELNRGWKAFTAHREQWRFVSRLQKSTATTTTAAAAVAAVKMLTTQATFCTISSNYRAVIRRSGHRRISQRPRYKQKLSQQCYCSYVITDVFLAPINLFYVRPNRENVNRAKSSSQQAQFVVDTLRFRQIGLFA